MSLLWHLVMIKKINFPKFLQSWFFKHLRHLLKGRFCIVEKSNNKISMCVDVIIKKIEVSPTQAYQVLLGPKFLSQVFMTNCHFSFNANSFVRTAIRSVTHSFRRQKLKWKSLNGEYNSWMNLWRKILLLSTSIWFLISNFLNCTHPHKDWGSEWL